MRRQHSATECPRANHISQTPQRRYGQTQHVTGSYCTKQTRKVTACITEISAGICQGTNTHTTYCLTVCLCPKPVFSVNFLSCAHFSVWHLFFLKVPCSPQGNVYGLQQRPPLNNRCRWRAEASYKKMCCSCKKNHRCRNICGYNLQLCVCRVALSFSKEENLVLHCLDTDQWVTWNSEIFKSSTMNNLRLLNTVGTSHKILLEYLGSKSETDDTMTHASQHWTP